MPSPYTDLTGRTGFRRTLFGKLVLRVEIRVHYDPEICGERSTKWRDAQREDLAILRFLARRATPPPDADA